MQIATCLIADVAVRAQAMIGGVSASRSAIKNAVLAIQLTRKQDEQREKDQKEASALPPVLQKITNTPGHAPRGPHGPGSSHSHGHSESTGPAGPDLSALPKEGFRGSTVLSQHWRKKARLLRTRQGWLAGHRAFDHFRL